MLKVIHETSWKMGVRKLPFPRKRTAFFLGHPHWDFSACSAELWGLRHFSRIQLQRLGTRWHMMKWSNSESDSRNIREADIASSKDTPEPARKTLVAWPWEKPKREITWVVAQKKLESVKRENTDYCFDSCCAQSNRTLCTAFLNKQVHI